jgi:hypothetical protein
MKRHFSIIAFRFPKRLGDISTCGLETRETFFLRDLQNRHSDTVQQPELRNNSGNLGILANFPFENLIGVRLPVVIYLTLSQRLGKPRWSLSRRAEF